MSYKCGLDSASNQSEYEQNFSTAKSTDETISSSTVVSIRLIDFTTQEIVWQNTTPSSTRFCRPLRIAFEKETTEAIIAETTRVYSMMEQLTVAVIALEEGSITVHHEMLITMLDGKAINVVSETKSST